MTTTTPSIADRHAAVHAEVERARGELAALTAKRDTAASDHAAALLAGDVAAAARIDPGGHDAAIAALTGRLGRLEAAERSLAADVQAEQRREQLQVARDVAASSEAACRDALSTAQDLARQAAEAWREAMRLERVAEGDRRTVGQLETDLGLPVTYSPRFTTFNAVSVALDRQPVLRALAGEVK